MEVRGQSVGGQGGGWRSVCGWTGWKLEVSLWVDRLHVSLSVDRVEAGGQSVGGQGQSWEISLWVDRVEVGGQSVGGQGGSCRSVCGWTGWKL